MTFGGTVWAQLWYYLCMINMSRAHLLIQLSVFSLKYTHTSIRVCIDSHLHRFVSRLPAQSPRTT